jgi:hypothetical protein
MLAKPVSGNEWRWALKWAVVILIVGCLPYVAAWLAAPSGYQFGGILVNPLDGNSYLAKMRQGWAGGWMFHLTYTPEPHQGASIFLFYLGLGHVARLTAVPLIFIYHAARVLAGLALLLAVYAFVGRLTSDGRERRLAFWLVGFSAGLGWLGAAFGAFPIDLWVPEGFAFYSLMTNPHFPLAMALMLVVIGGVVWPASGVRCWLVPGLAAVALAVVQPFSLAGVYAAAALYLLVKWRLDHPRTGLLRDWPRPGITAAASAVMFSVPVLAYDYWVYITNPALMAWAGQNVTPAPSVLDLILGYGLVGLLAIAGGWMAVRQRDRAALALVVWSGVTLALVYMPLALQRRLIIGLGLPLAMLAALGLTRWVAARVPGQRARWLEALTVGFSVMGTLFLLLVLTLGALGQSKPPSLPGPLYLSQDEVAGMRWLLANAPDEVVLAAPRTSMLLPGRAGVRVFYGHPYETIDAPVKEAQAERFFRGQMSAEEWQELESRYSVGYVFFGPAERKMGPNELLAQMEPTFHQGEVTIYRVP